MQQECDDLDERLITLSTKSSQLYKDMYKMATLLRSNAYYTITLIFYLPSKEQGKPVFRLGKVLTVAYYHTITTAQIEELKASVYSWSGWLDQQIVAKNIGPTVFTINQHYLCYCPLECHR